MNPNTLIRLDRKGLLALAQKHRISQPSSLTKEQLIQKLAGKNAFKPALKRQASSKVQAKSSSARLAAKTPSASKEASVPVSGAKRLVENTKLRQSKATAADSKVQNVSAKNSKPVATRPSSAKGAFEPVGSPLQAIQTQPSKPKASVFGDELLNRKVPAKASGLKAPEQPITPSRPILRLSETRPQKSAARDTSLERVGGSVAPKSLALGRVSAQNPALPTEYGKDRVVVLVRDPHWIHCYWELSRQTMNRAQTALGQEFEGAQTALRLVKLGDRDCGLGEQIVREFHLPDGARNWYVDVPEPGTDYCVDVGYRSKNGRFYCMGRSNSVSTPRVAWGDQVENVWAEQDNRDAERLFALSGGLQPHAGSAELRHFFEEKLGHNPGSPTITSLGSGGFGFLGKERNFTFTLDADLVVHGTTEPSAKVTFQGEPIPLRPDGTFSLRFRLADGRHIMPAVSVSCTGMEERTIVLAIERNTKTLEPVVHEEEE
jgi:hypothetical protein